MVVGGFRAVKAAGPEAGKKTVAYIALQKIARIYEADNSLANLSLEGRLKKSQILVKPLVEDFFAWLKEFHSRIPSRTKTGNGFDYCLYQEPYLKYFLEDGEVPIDNNAALSEGFTYPHLLLQNRIRSGALLKRCG